MKLVKGTQNNSVKTVKSKLKYSTENYSVC